MASHWMRNKVNLLKACSILYDLVLVSLSSLFCPFLCLLRRSHNVYLNEPWRCPAHFTLRILSLRATFYILLACSHLAHDLSFQSNVSRTIAWLLWVPLFFMHNTCHTHKYIWTRVLSIIYLLQYHQEQFLSSPIST